MSEKTVLELDWDVEVTDCCDAQGKTVLGRVRSWEGFGQSVVNTLLSQRIG